MLTLWAVIRCWGAIRNNRSRFDRLTVFFAYFCAGATSTVPGDDGDEFNAQQIGGNCFVIRTSVACRWPRRRLLFALRLKSRAGRCRNDERRDAPQAIATP
jgi:hypothetical protein